MERPADVLVLSIVTIPEDLRFVTANLLSPLIVNMRTKRLARLVEGDLGGQPQVVRLAVGRGTVGRPEHP